MKMFLKIKTARAFFEKDPFLFFMLAFCVFLPFQFALNPATGIDLAIIRVIVPITFLTWLIVGVKKKLNLFSRSNLGYLLLLFVFLTAFSMIFSPNLPWSLRKLLFTLSLMPIFFITSFATNTIQKKYSVVFALVIGAIILSWLAIVQFAAQFVFGIDAVYLFLAKHVSPFFLGKSFSETVLTYPSWLVNASGVTYMRAVAIFPDPHMLSYFLGLLIPWSIALWVTTKKYSGLLAISVISLIAADIFSFTRGGYIALIAGAIAVLPLVSKKAACKILLGAGIITMFFFIAPRNPVTDRFSSSFDAQEGSNQARLSNWQQAIKIISTHPFGVGVGAYSLSVDPNATYREPIYAHNAYLDVAAELGIHTVIVFILMLLTVFISFWRLAQKNQFFVAGVASITIFSVHSLVENPLYSIHVFTLFLIIIALSASSKTNEEIVEHK